MRKPFLLLCIAMLATPAFASSSISTAIQQHMQPKESSATEAEEEKPKPKKAKKSSMISSLIKIMNSMEGCIDKEIGKGGWKRIQASGHKQKAAIRDLCEKGEQEEALTLQHGYASAMVRSADYKALHGCTQKYKQSLKGPIGSVFKDEMKRALPKTPEDICA